MTSSNPPRRGEVWLVNFDPTLGTEIQKIRPAVVISSDEIGVLPIKLRALIIKINHQTQSSIAHNCAVKKFSADREVRRSTCSVE